jgi:peptidoglycan/LPS O-acetylase OafA/YrhL
MWITPVAGIDWAFQKVSGSGWAGVDLFFVLSGFLITGILLDAKGGRHYFRNFYARRVLRIFPLYYLCVALVLVSSYIPFVANNFPEAAASVHHVQAWYWTYTTNFLVATHGFAAAPMRSAHFWSLAVEEQFYLLWPAIVLFTTRKRLAQICVALLVFCPLLRVAFFAAHVDPYAVFVLTPTRVDSLAMGALLAIGVRSEGGLARWRNLIVYAGASGAAFLLGTLVVRDRLANTSPEIETIGLTAIGAVSALLIYLAVTAAPKSGVHRVLAHPVLRAFGRYSYGLYVLHFPIMGLLHARKLAPDAIAPILGSHLLPQLGFTAVSVAVSFAVAFASWHLFENPILSLKSHFPYERQKPKPEAEQEQAGVRFGPVSV